LQDGYGINTEKGFNLNKVN